MRIEDLNNDVKNKNNVYIKGILMESDIKTSTYDDKATGKKVENISGSILVRVPLKEEDGGVSDIKVHLFSKKYNNDNKVSKLYLGILDLKENYVSAASCGDIDKADRIVVSGGAVEMNEYWGRNDKLVSFPRITGKFFKKASATGFEPEATFEVQGVVLSMNPSGENEDMLALNMLVPQYASKSDVVPFIVKTPSVIQGIQTYWKTGDTVVVKGYINFSVTTTTYEEESFIGGTETKTRTTNVSELVILKGTAPMEDGYDYDSCERALDARDQRLKADKERSKTKTAEKTNANFLADRKNLGF